MTTKSTEERALLQHVIKTEADVPLQVFNVNFSTYLFFDNDICHSHDLINAIKMVVRASFADDSVAAVYSSYDFSFLGELCMDDDWVAKLASFNRRMNEEGDYHSLTIIDKTKQWALFQNTPVEDGVLGITSNRDSGCINDLIGEFFFNCETLAELLKEKTERDKSLVRTIGKEYIMKMIENYGNKLKGSREY